MLIALGRVDMDVRLNKFAESYDSTLSQLNVQIKYADLRYPNGFAVRKPPQLAAKEIAAPSVVKAMKSASQKV